MDRAKRHAGEMAFHGGLAAEAAVERAYIDRGHALAARRWRGTAGEIDLVLHAGEGFVFVEVKKSRSFAQAAQHLTPAQSRRILAAATEFVADKPLGQLTPMRFDVALCDAQGEIRIVENALGCA